MHWAISRTRALALLLVLAATALRAGVTVVQNGAPGATAWPGAPLLRTITNPATAAAPQSFTNITTVSSLGQTFTISGTNYLLQKINICAGGGSGTGPGTNLTLGLYDLGFQVAPEPTPYSGTPNETISANLFGGGSGLNIAYSNQPNGVLEFDFTNADQVVLRAGHMYAFELGGPANRGALNWLAVTTGNPYAAGAAYTNKIWLAGNAAELAMAVYAAVYTNVIPMPAPQTGACTVNWNDLRQRIDGFGASSAWGSSWSPAQADMFFSTNTGIGLSLLRTRIAPGGTTVENTLMQMAQARGASVWSTPWSPAAQFKSNTNVNGGSFVGNAANYQAYANQLAGYVVNMKNAYGVTLYALSIQNEPDANVTTYESCNWTAQQIHDFVPYLHDALAANNVAGTRLILPESQNWQDYQGLATTAMNDPNVAAQVSILANHNYDGATGPGSLTKNTYGKALWETEVSFLSGSASSIYNGVYWAGRIHLYLTAAQASAWHHWWLISGATSANQGLLNTAKNPTKRMYAIGNYSRFVRPGFYRLGVVTNQGAAMVSAYKDPVSGNFAIVAINANATNALNLTVNLGSFSANAVTPWVTSASLSLAGQAPVVVSNATFTYAIPGPGVVTFVGQGWTNRAPTNIILSAAAVSENRPAGTGVGTFSTGDPDAANTFQYALVGGAGAADNGAFAITNHTLYTAACLDGSAQNTRSIRVRSTDQGTLFAEKTFIITVLTDPQARKILAMTPAAGGNQTITFGGIPGGHYRVQAATNLWPPINWMDLTNNQDGTTIFTAGSNGLWLHTDGNAAAHPFRFYRTGTP